MTDRSLSSMRELDSRVADGIQVRLLWCEHDGRVWVSVLDTKVCDAFCVEVRRGDRPLDVFHHPYGYAGHQGVTAIERLGAGNADEALAG